MVVKLDAQTWVGMAFVVPVLGSEQDKSGLKGGYGFVAYRDRGFIEGLKILKAELAEGGSDLVGFEWLHRIEDNERELRASDLELIERLDSYPVQFHEFDWFEDD